MMKTCLNCTTELQGNFCSNCGQGADTHKINSHFLLHDIQHGLLHVDKGILFTVKELFTRPGHTIREFLEGKRVNHFKPISLVIVMAGIYGFLSHFFHINLLSNNYSISGSGEEFIQIKETIEAMSEWLSNHYALVALLTIPIFSIGTYIGFKTAGYNFLEHVVIHSFLTGQRLILHILTFPLYYYYNGGPHLKITARIIDITGYFLMAWALIQLFKRYKLIEQIARIMLCFIISFAIQLVIMILIFRHLITS